MRNNAQFNKGADNSTSGKAQQIGIFHLIAYWHAPVSMVAWIVTDVTVQEIWKLAERDMQTSG
jgi:hypothetical protein